MAYYKRENTLPYLNHEVWQVWQAGSVEPPFGAIPNYTTWQA